MNQVVDEAQRRAGTVRYSSLLAALLLALALPPVLGSIVPAVRVGLTGVLLTALWAVSTQRWALWAGLALALPVFLLDWGSLLTGSPALSAVSSLAAAAFLGLVVVSIASNLMATSRVTADTVIGGICLYLLLGLLWGSAYQVLELLQPGAFLLQGQPLQEAAEAGRELYRRPELLYFSFVTLTTLGYGDMVPASDAARSLSALEAILGQLYVAIFVARLVGLHLAQAGNQRS